MMCYIVHRATIAFLLILSEQKDHIAVDHVKELLHIHLMCVVLDLPCLLILLACESFSTIVNEDCRIFAEQIFGNQNSFVLLNKPANGATPSPYCINYIIDELK